MFILAETAETFSDKKCESYKIFLFLFDRGYSTIFVMIQNSGGDLFEPLLFKKPGLHSGRVCGLPF